MQIKFFLQKLLKNIFQWILNQRQICLAVILAFFAHLKAKRAQKGEKTKNIFKA
jgi:hypothetical protein